MKMGWCHMLRSIQHPDLGIQLKLTMMLVLWT